MKKITLLFLLFLSFSAFAQFPESFETAVPPTGWTTFRGANGIGTVQDWTVEFLSKSNNYEIKTTHIEDEIDLQKEVEKFVWADLIIYMNIQKL